MTKLAVLVLLLAGVWLHEPAAVSAQEGRVCADAVVQSTTPDQFCITSRTTAEARAALQYFLENYCYDVGDEACKKAACPAPEGNKPPEACAAGTAGSSLKRERYDAPTEVCRPLPTPTGTPAPVSYQCCLPTVSPSSPIQRFTCRCHCEACKTGVKLIPHRAASARGSSAQARREAAQEVCEDECSRYTCNQDPKDPSATQVCMPQTLKGGCNETRALSGLGEARRISGGGCKCACGPAPTPTPE
jgi:hypothetical protein